MDLLVAVALGIVQGLTEWLPVSSTAHLALAEKVFGVETPLFFNVMLHFGTLLAVVVYFDHEIKDLILAKGKLFKNNRTPEEEVLVKRLKLLIIGTLPIFIIGFILESFVAEHFYNLALIGTSLIVTGAALFSITSLVPRLVKNVDDLSYRQSIIVGLAQALAILPGISRSGITISTGIHLGIRRDVATRFSILLSIPAILGATVYELLSADNVQVALDAATVLGMAVSAIVGYLAIRMLVKIIKQKKFHLFSYYCWALGALIIYLYLNP